MLGDQGLELADQLRVPAQLQVGGDPILSAAEPELLPAWRSPPERTARMQSRRAAARARERARRSAVGGGRRVAPSSASRPARLSARSAADRAARPRVRCAYPGARVTIVSCARRQGSSSFRSCEIRTDSALRARLRRATRPTAGRSGDRSRPSRRRGAAGSPAAHAAADRGAAPGASAQTSSGPRMREFQTVWAERTTPGGPGGAELWPLPPRCRRVTGVETLAHGELPRDLRGAGARGRRRGARERANARVRLARARSRKSPFRSLAGSTIASAPGAASASEPHPPGGTR